MEGHISHSSRVLRRCRSEQSSCSCEFGCRSFINIRREQFVSKEKNSHFFISQNIFTVRFVLRLKNTAKVLTSKKKKKNSLVQYVIMLLSFIYLLEIMNIPAYTSPNLILGRTFDRNTLSARADISSSSNDELVKSIDINKFSFKYQVVKSSQDVNDLLDISGELSLQIKANLLKVQGAGQYLKENEVQEGRTNLLAVMKCITVMYVLFLEIPMPSFAKTSAIPKLLKISMNKC